MQPKRIQIHHEPTWRMPENCVDVSFPGRFCNPFDPIRTRLTPAESVEELRREFALIPEAELKEFLRPLRGKDLACTCPIGTPCHADLVLQLANPEIDNDESQNQN